MALHLPALMKHDDLAGSFLLLVCDDGRVFTGQDSVMSYGEIVR
jgi:hypothetical protein